MNQTCFLNGVSKSSMNKHDIKISVILPVYNADKHLEKTIESIVTQSYTNMEIIAINDCSNDKSLEILITYKEKDNRIKIHNLDTNAGVAVARNIGINSAQGKYIAFIDSDDIWKSDKLERQLLFMIEKGVVFSYTSIEYIDENSIIMKNKRQIKKVATYKSLLRNTVIATSTVMINKDEIHDIHMPLLRSGQDYAAWLKILRKGIVAHGIDSPLTQYRISSKSLSSNKFKSIMQVWKIQRDYENISLINRVINILFYIYNASIKRLL